MLCALFIFAALFTSLTPVRAQDATPVASAGPIQVIASGLTNPRGFDWSADGTPYLALAGSGGETRIEVAEGFTGDIGLSSSVVTVADGCTTPVVQGLELFLWEEAGWIWGAMDVTVLNGDLYALLS